MSEPIPIQNEIYSNLKHPLDFLDPWSRRISFTDAENAENKTERTGVIHVTTNPRRKIFPFLERIPRGYSTFLERRRSGGTEGRTNVTRTRVRKLEKKVHARRIHATQVSSSLFAGREAHKY